MSRDEARMGEFLREYNPPLVSLNATLNYFLTKPVKLPPSALITMEVQFPDVSFWQGEVDYEIMSTKTKAIILRAGQNTWVDTQFDRNYAEAKRKGLLVGVYWFFDGRASPGEQAELLISLLRNKKLELEVYIDWEHNYGGAHEGLRNVVAMMEAVERAGLDIKGVGLYTGYYFFRANSNPAANASQYIYLKGRVLWEAWYTNNSAEVLVPAPWTALTHWQLGTPVVAWGQQSLEIDMNFFNGTKQEFEQRYGISGEPTMADYVEIRSLSGNNHSIRGTTQYPITPHILGSVVTTLLAGTVARTNPENYYVYASDVFVSGVKRAAMGDKWWRVSVGGLTGWIAEIHMGVAQTSATLVRENEPSEPHVVEVYIDGVQVFRTELP
jgi:GH25 family lysozyme M1 (1,4-beta-N-acetylmuramidase)